MPTLVVEDGNGYTNSNTYVSLADSSTILDEYLDPATFDDLDATVRQRALVNATRKIEAKYSEMWRGRRTKLDQALAWPRTDAIDADGWVWDSDEIPRELKHAQVLLAYEIATGAEASISRSEGGNVEALSVGRGAVELTFGEGSRSETITLWEEILLLLTEGGLGSGSGMIDLVKG